MAQNTQKVEIYDPDFSLQAKIGVPNLDEIFTKDVIKRAQETVEESSVVFLEESSKAMKGLRTAFNDLEKNPTQMNPSLLSVINAAFSIKSKTGQAGNVLASTLAQSLQRHSEQALLEGTPSKMIEILGWHVDSLEIFLKKNIHGYGGEAGEAFLRELSQLQPNRSGL